MTDQFLNLKAERSAIMSMIESTPSEDGINLGSLRCKLEQVESDISTLGAEPKLDMNFLRNQVRGFAEMEATAKRVKEDTARYSTIEGYVPNREASHEA